MRFLSLLILSALLASPSAGYSQDSPQDREDAREERMKILRAADQMDMLQRNSEAANAKIATLEATVAELQKENQRLTTVVKEMSEQVIALQKAQTEQQKVIMEEIRKLLASNKPAPAPAASQKEEPAGNRDGKWYVHVVEQGQTLSAIAQAYRDQGVNVSVEDIRKANDIKADNLIRVGQKLYIPKS